MTKWQKMEEEYAKTQNKTLYALRVLAACPLKEAEKESKKQLLLGLKGVRDLARWALKDLLKGQLK